VNYGDIANTMANMAIFHIPVYGKLFHFITPFYFITSMVDLCPVTAYHEHYHMVYVNYPPI